MVLKEQFEQRCGNINDELYQHVLRLAFDDLRQYAQLTEDEKQTLQDPGQFPPSNHETERMDQMRTRLLESMEIIYRIVQRNRL
jgi:hypothetical protein